MLGLDRGDRVAAERKPGPAVRLIDEGGDHLGQLSGLPGWLWLISAAFVRTAPAGSA
jgi:hypothetical protein